MPVPRFVLDLRRKVGHDPLWLTGLAAVVTDDGGRILLTRRADTGCWALPSGILEPGEQPAQAIVREVLEEACVRVVVTRLCSVVSDHSPFALPNGDIVQFLTLTFACRYLGGDAAVGDDENLAVDWFAPSDLPPVNERNADRLHGALHPTGGSSEVYFER